MLSIGELAHRTGVSVRMLRHYDALGLVAPQRIDPASGYRWYSAAQVGRVSGLVALKDLGFTLDQCRALLDDLPVERLRDMLRLRRDELEQRIAADRERLAGVERRLRAIEREQSMTTETLRLQSLPALRLAQVSGEVNDTSEIKSMVRALAASLTGQLTAAGVPDGLRVHTYFGRPDGSKIDVAVGVPLVSGAVPVSGLELVELPAVERAAVVTHRRSLDDTGDPWLTIDAALESHDLESHGVYRQVFVEYLDDGEYVAEFQCPVRDRGSACL
ncbi:MerR family transcriptional regulator [Actinokineospora enzanensis]|uniref:MerR family transcriptional regulator n=1 Tax=Actinokineospora enzanensis TaxID=155975 RepID=UPI000372B622|nr:MerR family transcriptional regulator [Actinokineospora enzanensis]